MNKDEQDPSVATPITEISRVKVFLTLALVFVSLETIINRNYPSSSIANVLSRDGSTSNCDQLRTEFRGLRDRLHALRHPATGTLGNATREKAYDRIEKDLNRFGQALAPKIERIKACNTKVKVLQSMMKKDEQDLLIKIITEIGPSTSYFEWGSGGSTDTIGRYTTGTIVSIENFKPWCDKVSNLPFVKCRSKLNSLDYKCIIPYPTKHAGYPIDARHNGDFDVYINAIEKFPNFDVVLVDARWRVACALKALDYIRDDTIVLIHDVNPKRMYYNVLFDKTNGWYDVVERSSALVAMKRRKNTPRPTAETFNYYKNRPAY